MNPFNEYGNGKITYPPAQAPVNGYAVGHNPCGGQGLGANVNNGANWNAPGQFPHAGVPGNPFPGAYYSRYYYWLTGAMARYGLTVLPDPCDSRWFAQGG